MQYELANLHRNYGNAVILLVKKVYTIFDDEVVFKGILFSDIKEIQNDISDFSNKNIIANCTNLTFEIYYNF